MNADAPPSPTRGHRKKARTRRRLLESGARMYALHGSRLTVDHVTREAEVSHGTFYNYFSCLDELVEAVALHVFEQLASALAEAGDPDPARRFAAVTLTGLRTLAASPDLAAVLLRLAGSGAPAQGVFVHLRADLAAGQRTGRFAASDLELTADLIVGALLVCLRRIHMGEFPEGHGEAVVEHLLGLLGVDPAEARALVADCAVGAPQAAASPV